jgi:hypothetical protein
MECRRTADLRIVPLGSGGAVLDLDRFLNYRDTNMVIQASEIEGFVSLLKTLRVLKHLASLKVEVIPKN